MCVFSLCVVEGPASLCEKKLRDLSRQWVVGSYGAYGYGQWSRYWSWSSPCWSCTDLGGAGTGTLSGWALNSDSAACSLPTSTYVYLRLTATYLGTMVTRRVGRPRRIYSLESRRVSRGTVGSTGWSRVRVAATQTTGGLVVTLRCFPGFGSVWGMGHVVMRSDGSWRMCWIRRLPV